MDKSLDLSTAIVRPISLPTAGSILNAGTTCIVSGWGTTYVIPLHILDTSKISCFSHFKCFPFFFFCCKAGGTVSDVLRKVAVPVVSNNDCDSMYGAGSILPSMMCAGFVAGKVDIIHKNQLAVSLNK